MKKNQFWVALGKALVAFTILLIVLSTLAPEANAAKYKNLYAFKGGADGRDPSGVVIDSAGNLYGTTSGGGAFGYGMVFKVDTAGAMTVLYSFTGGADGAVPHPYEALTLDAIGNVYGITYEGGAYGGGTVFKLDTNGEETVLYSFTGGADGGRPTGGVIFDQEGNLYGTTIRGGNYYGVLFKLTPNLDGTWSETVLHSFPAYSGDAAEPYAGLSWDVAGNLYGATWQGGAYGAGTIFKFDTNGVESVLHSFTGADGAHAYKPPIFDAAGNIYDTTAFGGDYSCPSSMGGCGTVFKLDTSGNLTMLHAFTGDKDGSFSVGGLIFDHAGNFYGTAEFGGAHGFGVVFVGVVGQDGSVKGKLLHAFAGHPGADPISTLVSDANGNLYGTTYGDDIERFGTVFKITP